MQYLFLYLHNRMNMHKHLHHLLQLNFQNYQENILILFWIDKIYHLQHILYINFHHHLQDEIHNDKLILPMERPDTVNVWHQYVIRCKERDALIAHLESQGIGTIIHYPIPPHLAEAYQYLGHEKGAYPITEQYANEVLSIPMYNGMTGEEQDRVINALNNF